MARPAIMLLDVRMPRMSGLEAAQILKKDALFSHVPIVALTAHARAHERETYLAGGFDDVLEKPCLPSDVAQVVARLVGVRGNN
jgi:CheY-like chemotaxis protein